MIGINKKERNEQRNKGMKETGKRKKIMNFQTKKEINKTQNEINEKLTK